MSLPHTSIRIFQCLLNGWVLVYLLTSWPASGALWLDPVSPLIPAHGWRSMLVNPYGAGLGLWTAPFVALLLMLLALWGMLRASRWWAALLLWWGFTALMNLSFLASSGGIQLVSNLLFWNMVLSIGQRGQWSVEQVSRSGWWQIAAFWIIRLQLLLAYLATGLHKLGGTHWTDGTAMGIVATDPAFGPRWIADLPWVAMVLGHAVLLFQLTFPLAVWWRITRVPWMILGVLFHLGTVIWMGIPEMAFAFLITYAIWWSASESEAVLQRFSWVQRAALRPKRN